MTKLEKLIEKLENLPKKDFLKFVAEWHGEQFLWDNFKDSLNSIEADEGTKVAIEYIEETLKTCKIKI